jgi:hypothetical protein
MIGFVCSNGNTFDPGPNSGITKYSFHGNESVIPAVAASNATRGVRPMSRPYDVYQIHLWIDYEAFSGTEVAGS